MTHEEMHRAANLRASRNTLISQMELYGILPLQAEIQVDALIDAAKVMTPEEVDRAISEGKARDKVGRRQGKEGA